MHLDDSNGSRQGDEHHEQNAHPGHLLALAHVLHDIALDQVERERRGRRQHERRQRRHRSRENHDHQHAEQDVRNVRNERGHDRVVNDGASLRVVLDELSCSRVVDGQATETTQEVATSSDDKREHRRDDGTLLDSRAALDGVELLDHLRQAPRAERREHYDADQVEQVRPEETRVGTLHRRVRRLNLRQRNDCFGESAVPVEHRPNDSNNADEHDASLDEVVHDGGHVTAQHYVNTRDKRHEDDAVLVRHVDAECNDDQARQAVVDRCRVRDEKHEDDGCWCDAQGLRVVALAEKLGHGRRLQAMRHLTSARTEHPPSQKRADDCVADTCPCG